MSQTSAGTGRVRRVPIGSGHLRAQVLLVAAAKTMASSRNEPAASGGLLGGLRPRWRDRGTTTSRRSPRSRVELAAPGTGIAVGAISIWNAANEENRSTGRSGTVWTRGPVDPSAGIDQPCGPMSASRTWSASSRSTTTGQRVFGRRSRPFDGPASRTVGLPHASDRRSTLLLRWRVRPTCLPAILTERGNLAVHRSSKRCIPILNKRNEL